MVQGADRPGQPNSGQRSIFGGGGPAFTQMPTYTPVTRGPEEPQAAPQPSYPPQTAGQPAAPAQPSPQPAPAPSQPAPQAASPSLQAQVQAQAAPAYQAPQSQPQAYGGNPQGQPQPVQPQPVQPQPVQPQPVQPQPMAAPEQAPQAYRAANYAEGAQATPNQSYSEQNLPDLSNADPGFPESIFPDFNTAAPGGADQNLGDASFPEPSFTDQTAAEAGAADQIFADPSLPEQGGDASFPDMNFAASPDFAHDDGSGHAPAGGDPRFAPLNEEASLAQGAPQAQMPQQAYAPQAPQPQAPQSDPGRQLLAFDAVYDQPPQIDLGGQQAPNPGLVPQEFLEADRSDADFIDESQVRPPRGAHSKMSILKGRSAFMVASALLGAIALGGAIAYAYKLSGGALDGETPIVTADARPVKEAPDQPGGKEFPHKNKLIYDRLTNGDAPESERLVPRQEDVAVPALPPATQTAGLPAPVATTDLGNPATTQAIAAGEEGADGGPRKVKTLVVRPDGSVEAPPAVAAAAEAAPAAAAAAPAAAAAAPAAAAAAAPGEAAPAAPQAAVLPVPAAPIPAPLATPAAPASQQVAAVAPKPAPAAPSKYVVQVGAHKSQTEALAIYADIQQKYPKLLGNYPPLVQKASVGGGTLYRLRVGPIANKSEAYKLCGQLKTQGTDCFVVAQ